MPFFNIFYKINIPQYEPRLQFFENIMVFILYRSPNLTGEFDFYAGGRKIDQGTLYRETEWGGTKTLMAKDAVEMIRKGDPLYEPAAYLNGTARPESLKWLLANRIIFNGEVMGYMSPRLMELIQTFSHLFTGTYLSYAGPKSVARGKLASLAGGLIDKKMRRVLVNVLKQVRSRPATLFEPARLQSLMIIQPVNFEPDGRQDMCDGCPDITVHQGKLVWSCRLEEMNRHGVFLQTVPKEDQCLLPPA